MRALAFPIILSLIRKCSRSPEEHKAFFQCELTHYFIKFSSRYATMKKHVVFWRLVLYSNDYKSKRIFAIRIRYLLITLLPLRGISVGAWTPAETSKSIPQLIEAGDFLDKVKKVWYLYTLHHNKSFIILINFTFSIQKTPQTTLSWSGYLKDCMLIY